MANTIDAKRFPSAADYLSRLPQGIASYPQCQVRIDTLDYMHKTHPELGADPGAPEAIRSIWENPPKGDWMPEVVGNALYLMLRETAFADDEAFLAWSYDASIDSFSKPWSRVLMFVLSPTLVVMGASRRWRAFHRSSWLDATPPERHEKRMVVHGSLRFPEYLFPELIVRMFGRAFVAALTSSNAREVECGIDERTDTSVLYEVSWEA